MPRAGLEGENARRELLSELAGHGLLIRVEHFGVKQQGVANVRGGGRGGEWLNSASAAFASAAASLRVSRLKKT